MHQPPLLGHYDVPAPMQLGHTTLASHHGHLIQPHAPQQLQPPQPQPTAFTSPPASHFPAPATVLNPTPTHAYIPQQQQRRRQRRQQQQQHQPPPSQQPPTQANFTLPTTLTPTTATPQPCTIPMQVASPAPVSATPQQQPTPTQQPPQQPPTQDILPPHPAPQQPAQGVAPAPATGGTSAAVTADPDQRGTLPPPLRRSRSHRRCHSRAHSRSQERRRKQRQQSSPSGQRRSKRHAKHRKSRTPRRSSRDSTKQSRRQSRKHRSSPSKPRALSMDSRPRSRSPPAVVLRSYSAVHGRPRSLPQREERQNRWHYRADQGIQAPPPSPRRPYRVPTPPAAPDRRQRPAPSFHLLDQVRKIASRIQSTTSPPTHPGLDRAQAARPTARPTARLQHAQHPQPRDIAGSGQTFFGPSIRPPRTSDTSRGSNTAASSHERQPQLQASRSDKELAKLERVQRPPQEDFLPFSEIYEHQNPKQHAVELTDVAQLTQTLLDIWPSTPT